MTRVDFYILPSDTPRQRALLACRLAEKAYQQQLQVYIHAASDQDSRELDDLLWTFRQGSFIPHALAGVAEADRPPVLIGHDSEPPTDQHEVLINAAHDIPDFFGRFERVTELVDQQPDRLQQARERYTFYRERGYELHSHKLKD